MKNNNEIAFWNRERELEELSRWYAKKPRLGVMHGRRRLGKTTLLRRWLRKTPGCYIQATEGTPASQRAALAEDLQTILPGFGEASYPSWRALFSALKRQWPSPPPAVVLDEFPYLAQSSPELPSVLQAMVDAPDAGRLPLFICGSSQRRTPLAAAFRRPARILQAGGPFYGA